MKLLLLSNKFPYPAQDGSSIAIMSMIDSMILAGIDVFLFSLNTQKHFKDISLFEAKYSKKLNFESSDIDTSIHLKNTLSNLLSSDPFHVSRFYNEETAMKLKNVLMKNEFEFVQFEGIFMAPYLDLIRKYTRAKCILRPHNIEYKIWERFISKESNPLKSVYLKLQTKRLKKYESEMIPKFDGILPISEVDAQFFSELTNEKVRAMGCAINLNAYSQLTNTKKDFFYLGAFDWPPNVAGINWFLNSVWPQVVKSIPDAKFYLAGRAMPDEFKKIKQKGVVPVGEVKDASDFYKTHGVMVVPLLSGSGIRIKIIEGLSFGKTIITTRIGAEGISVENGKNIFVADEAEEFAKAMIQIYDDDDKRVQIGNNAREFAKSTFDIQIMKDDLRHFYQSIN